jgi:hypothetical protein
MPISGLNKEVARVGRDLVLPEGVLGNRSRNDDMVFYFLANQTTETISPTVCEFRISGYEPEIWDPETGECYPAKNWKVENGRTKVELEFTPVDSFFVVFKTSTTSRGCSTPQESFSSVLDLSKGWSVQFDPDWGLEQAKPYPELQLWNKDADESIRYFSGTAVYKKTFEFSPNKEKQYQLDLGDVHNIAGVTLNGKTFPNQWKPPYIFNLAGALVEGENTIEISVTNVWKNRLIGDSLLPNTVKRKGANGSLFDIPAWVEDTTKLPDSRRKRTFLIYEPYIDSRKKSEEEISAMLAPSGLMGPVSLMCSD